MFMNLIIEKIEWIKNRFLFKYKESENSQSIINLKAIINIFNNIQDMNIKEIELDNILSKYYFGFTHIQEDTATEQTDFSYGYTQKEQEKIRSDIQNIYKDVTLHIIKNLTNSTPQSDITNIDFNIEALNG